MKPGKVILVGILIYGLIIVLLSGCYSISKAKSQFSRAAVAYPELPADYCARTYPPRDTVVKGKDSIRVDTLWGAGETFIIRDTLKSRDTIWIKTVERLPGQVITRTVLRTDTVYQENRAALDLCSIERGRAIAISTEKTKEADKWRKIARKRFWVIAGMGLIIVFGLFGFLRKKITGLK